MTEVSNNQKYHVVDTANKWKEYVFSIIQEQYLANDLTASQSVIIHVLYENGEQRMSDLAKLMGLSNSTVSGIIDKMEKKNILKRTRDITDRRVVYVYFTESYLKSVAEKRLVAESIFEELMENTSKEEQDIVLESFMILDRIVNRIIEKEETEN